MKKRQVVVKRSDVSRRSSSHGNGSGVRTARYAECQKNHAAGVGGYAVDGCREFMATAADAFVCAACGCHRNFHRKEEEVEDASCESSP